MIGNSNGVVRNLNATSDADRPAVEPELYGPATCGLTPLKSTVISSPLHFDTDFDRNMLTEVDAVVVHERFGFVNAVGNFFHRGARQLLALIEYQPHGLFERLDAVALEQSR